MTDQSTSTFEEIVAGFTPTLPCESRSHPLHRDGCESDGPAAYIIELLHPIAPAPGIRSHPPKGGQPLQQLVCEGRMIWLRGRLANTVNCEGCGETATLADWVRLLGPIASA